MVKYGPAPPTHQDGGWQTPPHTTQGVRGFPFSPASLLVAHPQLAVNDRRGVFNVGRGALQQPSACQQKQSLGQRIMSWAVSRAGGTDRVLTQV